MAAQGKCAVGGSRHTFSCICGNSFWAHSANLELTHHLHHDGACRGILYAKTVRKQLAATGVAPHGHNPFVLLNYSPTICLNPPS
jgi:hypothetical protein